jgi:hypothetical protein
MGVDMVTSGAVWAIISEARRTELKLCPYR